MSTIAGAFRLCFLVVLGIIFTFGGAALTLAFHFILTPSIWHYNRIYIVMFGIIVIIFYAYIFITTIDMNLSRLKIFIFWTMYLVICAIDLLFFVDRVAIGVFLALLPLGFYSVRRYGQRQFGFP